MKDNRKQTKSGVTIYGDEFFAKDGKDIKEIIKDLIIREMKTLDLSEHEA